MKSDAEREAAGEATDRRVLALLSEGGWSIDFIREVGGVERIEQLTGVEIDEFTTAEQVQEAAIDRLTQSGEEEQEADLDAHHSVAAAEQRAADRALLLALKRGEIGRSDTAAHARLEEIGVVFEGGDPLEDQATYILNALDA